MKISEPFKLPGGEAGVDLWPLYDLLLDVPMLILRGEKSDILEKATAAKMVKKAKQAQLVTIKGIGHAPSLDEPDAQLAIAGFLKSLK
jgi:pimeloyl-ACP methyl ester carboxylesterase